jgi:hypothetical protein
MSLELQTGGASAGKSAFAVTVYRSARSTQAYQSGLTAELNVILSCLQASPIVHQNLGGVIDMAVSTFRAYSSIFIAECSACFV